MPAPVAVARLLLRLLDTIERTSPACSATSTPSSCTTCGSRSGAPGRRSSSSATCCPPTWPSRFRPEFKWLGDLTTPTRDLDVHLLGFDAHDRAAGRRVRRHDLEPFARLPGAAAAPASSGGWPRRCARPRFRASPSDWRKALLEIRDARRPPGADPSHRGRAGRCPRPAASFRRIAAHGAAITADVAPGSPARPAQARARSCATCWSSSRRCTTRCAYRKVVCDLKQLQDCLGEFQDSEVQRARDPHAG